MSYKPTGIIHLTGEWDTGKTLAALFVNYKNGIPLKKIAFFHNDTKEPGYDKKDFGLFVDLVVETKGMKLFEYRKFILDQLEKIKPKQYQAIVFDTWTRFGESLRNYVVNNRYEFRNKDEFIMTHEPKVVGAQTWKDAYAHEASTVSNIASITDCLVVTSHLKDDFQAGAKTGKQIDELGKTWDKVCNLRLWLRHNEDSGVPIALVLKRIHKPTISENGIATTVDVLPRRIKPLEAEKSIWECVNRYWENPINNRKPEADEKPNEFELSILDGILTKDQKEVWYAELKEKQRQEKEMQEFLDTQYDEAKAFVNELAQAHNSLPKPAIANAIKKEVQEKYPDYETKDIAEMIGD